MRARTHPRWLTRPMLLAIQSGAVLDRHRAIVEAALAAPRKLHDRDPSADVATLAAVYATSLAQTHGFIPGSKRAAFLSAYTFLGLNGYDLDVPEPHVVSVIDRLASREIGQPEVADWLRKVCVAADRGASYQSFMDDLLERPRRVMRGRGKRDA